jgi:hypothetical protein
MIVYLLYTGKDSDYKQNTSKERGWEEQGENMCTYFYVGTWEYFSV